MKIIKTDTPEQNTGRKIKVNTDAKRINEITENNIEKPTVQTESRDLSSPIVVGRVEIDTKDSSSKVASELNDKMDKLEARRQKRLRRRRLSAFIKFIVVVIIILAFIINPTLNNWITTIFSDLKDLIQGLIAGEDISNNEILYHLFNLPNSTIKQTQYYVDENGAILNEIENIIQQ